MAGLLKIPSQFTGLKRGTRQIAMKIRRPGAPAEKSYRMIFPRKLTRRAVVQQL